MKLKSSWNLAGWNLLNIINLRKRGGNSTEKKHRCSNKIWIFRKNRPLVVGGRTLGPMEETPHFFGMFWSQSLRQALHVWPVPADSTTGTFQRSKNGRFFFRQKKNHTLLRTLKWMRKLRLCFFVWRNLLLKKFNISNILRGVRWFATHLKHMSNHKSRWRWWFPTLIYLFLNHVRKSSNWIRKNSGKHHPSTCLLLPTFNTGCLFGFVGLGGVRATSGVLFLKPQHHKKLQKRGTLFSNPEISGKKEGFGSFHHGLQSWMVKE